MSGAQSLVNSTAFKEATQYSQFILKTLPDGLMPGQFWRNVTDFGRGETLYIKTIGRTTLQEVSDTTPPIYNPIETGEITLSITDFVGDAWSVKDTLREDGNQVEALMAERAMEATRAIQENFETRALTVLNSAQTAANANTINGFAHRIAANGTNATIELADLIYMKLAFDKANVPYAGRILIVDPVVEATLNSIFQATASVDSNPTLQNILEGGFGRDHQFVMNIFGWNIITSNRLPRIASETLNDRLGNSTGITTGVANIAMSIFSDQHKPLMAAWRRMPKVEPGRNKDLQQDEFFATARYGLGAQRVDTLGVIITDETATA
jgi:hypothetical protein